MTRAYDHAILPQQIYVSGSNVGVGTTSPTYKLQVNGSFAATTKSFSIDHPSNPGMILNYGSLESPYHGVRLTGRDKTNYGVCFVQLPSYIKDLVNEEDVNIQITNIKHSKILYVDSINIKDNNFVVRYDGQEDLEFFWTFTGIRKDVDKLLVEEAKL